MIAKIAIYFLLRYCGRRFSLNVKPRNSLNEEYVFTPDRQLLRRDPNTPFVSIRPIFSAGGISYNLCITFSSKFSYHLIHDPLQMMHFIGSAVTTSQLNSPLYSFCSSVILNPHAYISYSENMHTINCGCHFSAGRLHCCLIPSKILSASCWGTGRKKPANTFNDTRGSGDDFLYHRLCLLFTQAGYLTMPDPVASLYSIYLVIVATATYGHRQFALLPGYLIVPMTDHRPCRQHIIVWCKVITSLAQ